MLAHGDVLLYLAPSIALALLFRWLASRHPVFLAFYLTGTIVHELAHLLAGLVTNARPVRYTIIPKRTANNGWMLGSVSFANLRWYNAVFVGMAPLVTIGVPLMVALFRLQNPAAYGWWDVLLAVLIAPMFTSCLPSAVDLRLSLRSWPYGAVGILAWWWLQR